MSSYYIGTTGTTCKHPHPTDAMKERNERKTKKKGTKVWKETEKKITKSIRQKAQGRLHTGLDPAAGMGPNATGNTTIWMSTSRRTV